MVSPHYTMTNLKFSTKKVLKIGNQNFKLPQTSLAACKNICLQKLHNCWSMFLKMLKFKFIKYVK